MISRKSSPNRPAAARSATGCDIAMVRRFALALPATTERLSYGTAGFRVQDKLFARVLEDGESIVVKCDLYERDGLLESQPRTFQVTDHYLKYPMVIVRLASIGPDALREVLTQAWRFTATRSLVTRFDAQRTR